MAEAIVSAISLVVDQLGSGTYRKIMFARDLDSHIKRLQKLKTTIEATILDARSLQSCTNAQKDALEKLDCAFADLIDFLDAKAAKAKQKEIMLGNRFIKQLRLFFSKSNQLVSPFRDAHKLKAIIEQFESVSRDQALIRDIVVLPCASKSTQILNTESLWSKCHILTEAVIGRDKDRDEMVSVLLDDTLSSQTLSVASIVGIGGVGKTTLAKYVYHDERVIGWFDIRLWVSISKEFDVQGVLQKILLANYRDQMLANCNIVQMYDFFNQAISRKKLLLVLDNVWDQEGLRQRWLELRSLLALGADGSKVLVTTRNEDVAGILDCVKPFVLGDLTKEDSWLLFQKIAFTQFQEPGVEAIGRQIVEMCRDVPLVIRSIGGLLAGKRTVMEWLAFRDDQLVNFSVYGRDIMQTLRLSYDHLDERLKLCVAYCSLFPKRYVYARVKMIRLWISLGYIVPSYRRQQLEDAAEECILMLIMQGFFSIEGEKGLIVHDLMHDLMVSIAGYKYKMATVDCEIDERVRHLSVFQKLSVTESMNMLSSIFKLKQLHSLLLLYKPFEWSQLCISKKIFHVFPRLRILSLVAIGIEKVPSSLGELITLRYLDLSHNPMTYLPNSITQLGELLSLNVSYCFQLLEFPKGIRKLVKLRHLVNYVCPAVMPKGVASLADLQTLDELPLEVSEWFPRESNGGLAELNSIIHRLAGGIHIIFSGDASDGCFKDKKVQRESIGNLKCMELEFLDGSRKGDEMIMEALEPNTNMQKLVVDEYRGERLPRWMTDRIHHIENLADIQLCNFKSCRSLGCFGKLRRLKRLVCRNLENVEYIEEPWCEGSSPCAPLFPSLEELVLKDMPKLKKWYKVSNGETSTSSYVQFQDRTPSVNKILPRLTPERDSFLESTGRNLIEGGNTLLTPQMGFPKLRDLGVTKMEFVISMTREFRGFSSLENLEINDCADFKAIPDGNGIPNISNLKSLKLYNCSEELQDRCCEPNGEDLPKIKHIPYVCITELDFNTIFS